MPIVQVFEKQDELNTDFIKNVLSSYHVIALLLHEVLWTAPLTSWKAVTRRPWNLPLTILV